MVGRIKEMQLGSFTWIDLLSPSKEQIHELAAKHKLDYFLIYDSLEPGHLPKIEQYEDFTFIILRAYTAKVEDNVTSVQELTSKVAFFIGKDLLITVHRPDFPFLLDIKETIDGNITIYDLVIHIFKHIVDSFIEPATWHSNHIDEVERIIFLKDLKKVSQEDLYYQKAELRISRKLLVLTQNTVAQLRIPVDYNTALQDVKDSLVRLILEYEEAIEDTNSLMNTYLSVTAQKNNDVMKLLTIFSAFFLPLSFIAGFYGMNFQFMPELKWEGGYPFVIALMVALSVVIYLWFRRKKIL